MAGREKIIEIAKVEFDIQFGCGDYIEIGDKEAFADSLADALIANGIGDISEWKKRAEKAELNDRIKERALDKATELAYEYRVADDTLSCSSCPMNWIFDRCKDRGLYIECSKRWKEEILRQSEKEITEEGK